MLFEIFLAAFLLMSVVLGVLHLRFLMLEQDVLPPHAETPLRFSLRALLGGMLACGGIFAVVGYLARNGYTTAALDVGILFTSHLCMAIGCLLAIAHRARRPLHKRLEHGPTTSGGCGAVAGGVAWIILYAGANQAGFVPSLRVPWWFASAVLIVWAYVTGGILGFFLVARSVRQTYEGQTSK